MKCPFLREACVKYCEVSAYRKMILTAARATGMERCSSPEYAACPVAASHLEEGSPQHESCPFLHESHAEFCGAAAVARYVPATSDLLSRCHSDAHSHCELYLAFADPEGMRKSEHGSRSARMPVVDGIPIPQDLSYAANHMWLDAAEDGHCHVGIDAFAARVFGKVHKITFVTPRGAGRPVAVLRVNGVDVPMVFPNAMHVIATNVYLRTTPQRMTDDPYGTGWLFESYEGTDARGVHGGLIDGRGAVDWMRGEVARLDEYVRDIATRGSDGASFMTDGGTVEEGIASRLAPDDLIGLTNEFFAAQREWGRTA